MTDFPSYPRGFWRSALPPAVVYDRHWACWIVGVGSLMARLRAASSRFRMRLLGQRRTMPLRDEWRCLGMSGPTETPVREALLICDEISVVHAHMIVYPRSVALDWPFLKVLGVQPLGYSLFADPRVQRGDFELVLLDAHHPLVRRVYDALDDMPIAGTVRLLARRSVLRRGASAMLVTEVFLPVLASFHSPR